jgi:NIMA (never in mitosis gene a)-related kinase 2
LGLSRALAQASFVNTYVATSYYMHLELMQEKAYDSKSHMWSLGWLIYGLRAFRLPFHKAKTHAEPFGEHLIMSPARNPFSFC